MSIIQTLPHTKVRINEVFSAKADFLATLRDRWQDEKEYEDFADYVEAMKKALPADIHLVKMTKSPFGFTFTVDNQPGAVYEMRATARQVRWGRVS